MGQKKFGEAEVKVFRQITVIFKQMGAGNVNLFSSILNGSFSAPNVVVLKVKFSTKNSSPYLSGPATLPTVTVRLDVIWS